MTDDPTEARHAKSVTVEDRLRLLANEYGQHLYVTINTDRPFGFAARGYSTKATFPTLDEAFAAEGAAIRDKIVEDQATIKRLQKQIDHRLVHLGMLEL